MPRVSLVREDPLQGGQDVGCRPAPGRVEHAQRDEARRRGDAGEAAVGGVAAVADQDAGDMGTVAVRVGARPLGEGGILRSVVERGRARLPHEVDGRHERLDVGVRRHAGVDHRDRDPGALQKALGHRRARRVGGLPGHVHRQRDRLVARQELDGRGGWPGPSTARRRQRHGHPARRAPQLALDPAPEPLEASCRSSAPGAFLKRTRTLTVSALRAGPPLRSLHLGAELPRPGWPAPWVRAEWRRPPAGRRRVRGPARDRPVMCLVIIHRTPGPPLCIKDAKGAASASARSPTVSFSAS